MLGVVALMLWNMARCSFVHHGAAYKNIKFSKSFINFVIISYKRGSQYPGWQERGLFRPAGHEFGSRHLPNTAVFKNGAWGTLNTPLAQRLLLWWVGVERGVLSGRFPSTFLDRGVNCGEGCARTFVFIGLCTIFNIPMF